MYCFHQNSVLSQGFTMTKKPSIMETMEMEPTTVNRDSQWWRRLDWFIHARINGCFFTFVCWIGYYICFCLATLRVSGLVFSHKLVDFAVLRILITYFTDYSVHEFHLNAAAIITNFQEALSGVLVILATWISYNSPTRPLKTMIFSTFSYTVGLFLLFSTTFDNFSEPIFDMFNFFGIILLAVGEAGVKPFLGEFLTNQIRYHNEQRRNGNEDQIKAQKKTCWRLAWCCSVGVAFAIHNCSWLTKFLLLGIVMGISLILFSSGYFSYHRRELIFETSPFIIFRVVKAALLKRNLNYPPAADMYVDNDDDQLYISPRIKFLRWLDKAAIRDPETQENGGRICTVPQVRESKLLLKLFPMWSTFLVFGLTLSAGKIFFPMQGTDLVSERFMTVLLIFQPILSEIISYLSNLSILKLVHEGKRRQAQIVRIFMGMVISVVCYIVAWRVEIHRLIIVRKEGLLDNSEQTIPMSIFWLVPQFCLLGLMDGLALDGLDEYVSDHFPGWIVDHVLAIKEFVIGIGSCLHILFVLGNKSLFSVTLNASRLDKYYMRLMIVCTANMICNGFLSIFYIRSDNA